jgi:hypothetical protein
MRTLFLFPFLLSFVSPVELQQGNVTSNENCPAVILSFKWDRSRHLAEPPDPAANTPPTRDAIPPNKITGRPLRGQPTGIKDPNEETLEGRQAAIEKDMQIKNPFPAKNVDGFEYRAKIQNATQKVMEVIFWEYQFTEIANPSNVVRRQFLCAVNLKPDKGKELLVFSVNGPSDVISVGSLANKSGKLFQEKVFINRVEYSDGSIWQRRDWNFGEVRAPLARALATPWNAEMCRGL